MLCDERNSDGLRSATWVPRWEYLLRISFERAITPDKLTTVPLTTLMDESFGQVSRALEDGALGPEACTLLLRLLNGHCDRVDGLQEITCFWGAYLDPFLRFQSRVSRGGIGSDRHRARSGLRG